MYVDRYRAVRKNLGKQGASSYYTSKPEEIRYLSGFRGDDSALLLAPAGLTVITDGRYLEEAEDTVREARKDGLRVRVVSRRNKGLVYAAAVAAGRGTVIGFEDTGLTVAAFIAFHEALKGKATLKPVKGPVAEVRKVKDPGEVRLIRKALAAAEAAMNDVRSGLRPGLSERQVAMMLHNALVAHGAEGPSFPIIVASGPGSSRPHYETSDRKLGAEEPILIDWGAKAEGYVSDLTRVLFIGKMPSHLERPYQALIVAREKGARLIRDGAEASKADWAAREAIDSAGFKDLFVHSLGHGIGLEVHEAPHLGPDSKDILLDGMVVTVEPGLYMHGEWGLRIEDDFLVRKSGCIKLSALPLDPEWAVVGR
jgi:Xaa-Pro aminopeptidase